MRRVRFLYEVFQKGLFKGSLVQGLGFRVLGSLGLWVFGFRVQGNGFRV